MMTDLIGQQVSLFQGSTIVVTGKIRALLGQLLPNERYGFVALIESDKTHTIDCYLLGEYRVTVV